MQHTESRRALFYWSQCNSEALCSRSLQSDGTARVLTAIMRHLDSYGWIDNSHSRDASDCGGVYQVNIDRIRQFFYHCDKPR